jgi:glucosamine--fructose-6-phosphate aminotransferase (isomerizing)
VVLASETDSEVLARLIAAEVVVLDAQRPDELVAARNGSPIVLGLGEGEMFVASDVSALVLHTRQVVYLEDGEVAMVRAGGVPHEHGRFPAYRSGTDHCGPERHGFELGGFSDYMDKEIQEQPEAVGRALLGRLDARLGTARLDGLGLDPRELRGIRRVKILGCGSAYYAGQLGAAMIEELARVPADAEPAE